MDEKPDDPQLLFGFPAIADEGATRATVTMLRWSGEWIVTKSGAAVHPIDVLRVNGQHVVNDGLLAASAGFASRSTSRSEGDPPPSA